MIGHCDTGPWNIVERCGRPVALIDWETAGPIDARVELAQGCWLNAQLHDDDVAEMCGLSDAESRARHARAIVDGYGLSARNRVGFVDLMVEVAVSDAASQVVAITPKTIDSEPLWAVTWRVKAASWMMRHRRLLERALA